MIISIYKIEYSCLRLISSSNNIILFFKILQAIELVFLSGSEEDNIFYLLFFFQLSGFSVPGTILHIFRDSLSSSLYPNRKGKLFE